MARFPSSITLTVDEAIEVLAALEDAATTLERSGDLAGVVEVTDAARIITEKLTEGWPDGD